MNDQTPTSAERAEKLQGMGCKRKRVEDIRFVQGKGNYVDDLRLPGMLYGDFARSPRSGRATASRSTPSRRASPRRRPRAPTWTTTPRQSRRSTGCATEASARRSPQSPTATTRLD